MTTKKNNQTKAKIARGRLADIHVDPANVRKHNKKNIEAIKASLLEFGQCKPLVVQKSTKKILAGNGTYIAMTELGWTECDVILVYMSDIRATAYAIADNRTAELATWDEEGLCALLSQIQVDGEIDTASLGFSDVDISGLLKNIGTPIPNLADDDAPPIAINEKPVAQAGDLWLLGKHRLLCGDSEKKENVDRLYSGRQPVLMVTDPPYGVNYDPEWRTVKKNIGKVTNDDRASWKKVWELWNANVAYVWHADTVRVGQDLADAGYEKITIITWAKQNFVMSRGNYHYQTERCFYVAKKGKNHNWQGSRDQSDLWQISNNNKSTNSEAEETWGHSTQKPLECMARPMRNNSERGDIVADPFLGSGTTLIAAEKLGRICYGCEIELGYCDMIIQRWEKETGKIAKMEDGTTWAQAKAKRNDQK